VTNIHQINGFAGRMISMLASLSNIWRRVDKSMPQAATLVTSR